MDGPQSILIVVALSLGLVQPLSAAPAGNPRSLTAEWWQWALSIPSSENPLDDPTGEKCMVGQRGPVWFLAGSFGGGPVTRSCSVPAGRTLFFPVANASFFDSPGVCGQGGSIPVPEARAGLADFVAGLVDVAAEVDGQPVEIRRVRSHVFAVALPEDNLFDAFCADFGGMPAGVYRPALDDGYYVRLEPLAAGSHTLHFHAEHPDFGFVIDTTYALTVVP